MPIYEYGCDKCGEVSERYEPYVDRQPPPPCCGEPTTKLISAGVFDLHGAGFYQNEHGNGAHKLSTTDQARRAGRELKERGYFPATPGKGKVQPTHAEIDGLKKKFGNKAWEAEVRGD